MRAGLHLTAMSLSPSLEIESRSHGAVTKICITLWQLDFFFFEDFIIHRFETLPVIIIKVRGVP